jgi:hypothetical protein
MTCSATSFAEEGIHYNRGKASGHTGGEPACRKSDEDDDKAWYKGKQEKVSFQGCTPGYWKNHTDSWPATGYKTWQSIKSVFPEADDYSGIRGKSLHQALYFGGGGSTEDAAKILLRAAVAGLLDSAHPGVNYPRSTASLIADVDSALGSHSRSTMLSLASAIDADNNLGCPLN